MSNITITPLRDARATSTRSGASCQLGPLVLSPAEVDRIRDVYTTQIEKDRSLGFDDGLPARRHPGPVSAHRAPAPAARLRGRSRSPWS